MCNKRSNISAAFHPFGPNVKVRIQLFLVFFFEREKWLDKNELIRDLCTNSRNLDIRINKHLRFDVLGGGTFHVIAILCMRRTHPYTHAPAKLKHIQSMFVRYAILLTAMYRMYDVRRHRIG